MEKYYYDFHIHTALSPCGDNDMTPNNIVNMAMIKGLDVIAVTDHNSAENVKVTAERAARRDIIVIPGMEIESAEEVHLVCLFPDVESATKMQQIVYAALPGIPNREDIFGEQRILNDEDEIVDKLPQMLITATSLSIEQIFEMIEVLGGICIPAHVDRSSYSILSNLGTIPEGLPVQLIEFSKNCNADDFLKEHPELKKYGLLRSSDAHYLWDMSERNNFFMTERRMTDPKDFIAFLKGASYDAFKQETE